MPNLWTSEDVFAILPSYFLFLCGQAQERHFRRLQEGTALLWRKPAGPWRTSVSPTIRVPPSISVHHLLCIHPCTHTVTACVLTKAHPHLSWERFISWSADFSFSPSNASSPANGAAIWLSHSHGIPDSSRTHGSLLCPLQFSGSHQHHTTLGLWTDSSCSQDQSLRSSGSLVSHFLLVHLDKQPIGWWEKRTLENFQVLSFALTVAEAQTRLICANPGHLHCRVMVTINLS